MEVTQINQLTYSHLIYFADNRSN